MQIQQLVVAVAIVFAIMAAAYMAYEQGYLDPIIEKVGVYMFKAKAAAEKKRLQAEGMKAGQDFADAQLDGVQQAGDVKKGLGAIGGLKKE